MSRTKTPPSKAIDTKKRNKTELYKLGNKIYKVNVTTLKAIKQLQNSVRHCIPKLSFCRFVREVIINNCGSYRVETTALTALQEAAEIYLTHLFEDSNKCAMHARRITLKPADMKLALLIRGPQDPGYIL